MPRWLTDSGYWLAHQGRVWRWGLAPIVLFVIYSLPVGFLGGWLALSLCWLFERTFTGWLWFGCSALFAPIFATHAFDALAGFAKTNPPPSDLDLWRKQEGLPAKRPTEAP